MELITVTTSYVTQCLAHRKSFKKYYYYYLVRTMHDFFLFLTVGISMENTERKKGLRGDVVDAVGASPYPLARTRGIYPKLVHDTLGA